MHKIASSAAAPPAAVGNYDSIDTAFSGDLGSCPFPVEHRITGSALGQPATGYKWTYELIPHFTYLYNSSGWNQSDSGNEGRTGASAYLSRIFHAGQGDAIGYFASVFANGSRAGSTNFLANPAAVLFGGNAMAGADGVYLNGAEYSLDDQSHDASGNGVVINLHRSSATANFGAMWVCFRSQSKGSQPIDVHFSGIGKARFGLDLSFSDFGSSQAAVTLKADQRIYGNVSPTDPTSVQRFPAGVGDDYLTFSSGLNGWNFVVDNGSRLQVVNNQVTVNTNLKVMGNVGFFGASPASKPTVTGSWSSGTAGASLVSALASLGLISNNTTA